MVVNRIQETLQGIGFSEYEARAYVSALKLQAATAYELAHESGIPTSKIYEIVGRLREKKLLFEVADDGKKKYAPLSGADFLDQARRLADKRFDDLARDLADLPLAREVSFIWNIHDYGFMMEKSARAIRDARATLLLSLWPEELKAIDGDLRAADKRGVKLAVIHFGPVAPGDRAGAWFAHPIEDTLYAERGGRGFTLVADSAVAVMGTIFGTGGVEGAWSANRGFVLLAEDYLKHDIYIMKIVNRFDRELIGRFGKKYARLRDIFTDRETRSAQS
jgi:HTH-type transcriptional regulator, sugar sensing transcriptional regulator